MEVINEGAQGGKKVQMTTIFTNVGYLALHFWDYADLFVTLSATQLQIRTNQISWNSAVTAIADSILGFETEFSWSAGARVILWEGCGFGLGIEGQYFQTSPEADFFDNLSPLGGHISHFNDLRVKYWEWQLA